MKRASLASATLLALALVGCGDNAAAPAPAPAPAPSPSAGMTPATAPSLTDDSVAAVKLQAEKLLTDAQTYVKEQKWDLADKALVQLDALKPKLPADYAARIDQLKQLIATGKTAAGNLGGLKMPG